MTTTTRLNIDKATVRQLFKAAVKASDEIQEKSFVYGQTKRLLPIQPLAQASEFYGTSRPDCFDNQWSP